MPHTIYNKDFLDTMQLFVRYQRDHARTVAWFKHFTHAAIAISGIELVHQIKKSQFDVSVLGPPQARTPQMREARLAA